MKRNPAPAPTVPRSARTGPAALEPYVVQAAPIVDEAFAPFGEVIALGRRVEPRPDPGTPGSVSQWGGYSIDTRDGEQLALDIITRRVAYPVELTGLSRHRKAPQVQVPLRGVPIFVLVAPPDVEFTDRTDLDSLRAFVTDGSVGINIAMGVWHDGAYPIVNEVDLVNLQGKGHATDTERIELDRLFGVVVHIRL